MAGVSQAAGAVRLPLLERRENVETVAIVPITGDRGLAGALQRAGAPPLARADARGRRPRARRSSGSAPGSKAASTLRFRRLEVAQSWVGLQRPARVQRRAGDRARGLRGVRERRGRPGRDRLQRVRLGARPEGDGARRAADPAGAARAQRGRRDDERSTAARRTSSTSPSPRRSSRGCCRSTSRPSSTARCSSRPRPSRAPG